MPFIGTPIVTQVSDQIVRVTGLAVQGEDTGTIALAGHTGAVPDLVLPGSFKTEHYTYGGRSVTLADAIQVEMAPVSSEIMIPVEVVKTGTSTADFRISLANPFGSDSPGLELYIKFHT